MSRKSWRARSSRMTGWGRAYSSDGSSLWCDVMAIRSVLRCLVGLHAAPSVLEHGFYVSHFRPQHVLNEISAVPVGQALAGARGLAHACAGARLQRLHPVAFMCAGLRVVPDGVEKDGLDPNFTERFE